jgi:hypothetical protein
VALRFVLRLASSVTHNTFQPAACLHSDLSLNSKPESHTHTRNAVASHSLSLPRRTQEIMCAFSPRRSARLAQEQSRAFASQSTPSFTYSQSSSATTTSHPSPTNNVLNPPPPPPTPQQNNLRNQLQSSFTMAQQSQFNAPLPSPSANEPNSFFGRSNSQPNSFASQQSAQTASPFEQSTYEQNQEQPSHLHPHSNSMSQPRHPINQMTPQMPADFLAEAAKRAQIACLMRDMGDVSL